MGYRDAGHARDLALLKLLAHSSESGESPPAHLIDLIKSELEGARLEFELVCEARAESYAGPSVCNWTVRPCPKHHAALSASDTGTSQQGDE